MFVKSKTTHRESKTSVEDLDENRQLALAICALNFAISQLLLF